MDLAKLVPIVDSREMQPGNRALFICLSEDSDKQKLYLEEAAKGGAIHSLAEILPGNRRKNSDQCTFLPHDEFQELIGKLSLNYHQNPGSKLQMLGVTGTNGKTTCVTLLRQLLEPDKRTASLGTLGLEEGATHIKTPWTTPESPILQSLLSKLVNENVTTVCMEVSSHGIAENRIYGLKFQGCLFTNLTNDHLDYHKTLEAYFETKKRLFTEFTARHGTMVVNADDPYGAGLAQSLLGNGLKCIRVGAYSDSSLNLDYAFEVLEQSLEGTCFRFRSPRNKMDLTLQIPLLGRHNVVNLSLVSALLLEMKQLTTEKLIERAPKLKAPCGRLERISLPKSNAVFVDFAHSPDALEKACESLLSFSGPKPPLTLVFGCGGDRDKGKRPLMGRVASKWAEHIVLTSDNSRSEDPRKIIAEIESGIPQDGKARVHVEVDRRTAIRKAYKLLDPGGVLLVAGKGHEMTQTDRTGVHPFSDQTELRKLQDV